jgi:oligoendopeptidase F
MIMTKYKTSWDFSPLLKSESEIEPELEKVKKANLEFVKKWSSRNDYLKDPKVLKQALDEYENLMRNYGNSGGPGYYFSTKYQIDQTNSEIKAKLNKVEELEKELRNSKKFFALNIAKIPEPEQKKFLPSPELKDYTHFLARAFQEAKHLLSENEEKILTLKESTSHDFWERLTSSLLAEQERKIKIEGKEETKNFSDFLGLIDNHDEKIRKEANKALTEIFNQYAEVAEQEINAILSNKKTNDALRNFPRPDSARHLTDDIETEVVDTLIKTVTSKFDIAKRFYKLKANLLNLKKLQYYEKNVPYKNNGKEYKFEESIELVKKTFSNLDKQFLSIFENYLEKGQIDVFPKKGKQNGAFCTHNLITQPTYILLNHTNTLKDVTTIAHEVGHGINNELMKEKQNALYFETPKSTAEVASTFMEDFVLQELLKGSNEETRLSILMERLNGEIASIFRQTAFYNFETELHNEFRKKGYLSKKFIGELFKKHMSSYLGEFVDCSECGNWWIYVPHFRYIFYVYSYASGLLISKSLQSKVKADHSFIEKVKEFLSAGTSDSPKNIFAKMDIDITKKEFWLQGLKEIEDLLNETEALAKKLGKI